VENTSPLFLLLTLASLQGFWNAWSQFELSHGNPDTFREMLRIKRSVQTLYNTQVNVNTAQMALGKMEELEKQAAAAAGNPALAYYLRVQSSLNLHLSQLRTFYRPARLPQPILRKSSSMMRTAQPPLLPPRQSWQPLQQAQPRQPAGEPWERWSAYARAASSSTVAGRKGSHASGFSLALPCT
jgi:hypothetical protein